MTTFIPGEYLFVDYWGPWHGFRQPVVGQICQWVIRQTDATHIVVTTYSHLDNTSGKTHRAFKIISSSPEPVR